MKKLEKAIITLLEPCGNSCLGKEQIPFLLQDYGLKAIHQKIHSLIKRGTLYEGTQNLIGLSANKRQPYKNQDVTITYSVMY